MCLVGHFHIYLFSVSCFNSWCKTRLWILLYFFRDNSPAVVPCPPAPRCPAHAFRGLVSRSFCLFFLPALCSVFLLVIIFFFFFLKPSAILLTYSSMCILKPLKESENAASHKRNYRTFLDLMGSVLSFRSPSRGAWAPSVSRCCGSPPPQRRVSGPGVSPVPASLALFRFLFLGNGTCGVLSSQWRWPRPHLADPQPTALLWSLGVSELPARLLF